MIINTEDIGKHGRLIAFNKIGERITLYGYIRELHEGYILWEDNETPARFFIKVPISFERVELKNEG